MRNRTLEFPALFSNVLGYVRKLRFPALFFNCFLDMFGSWGGGFFFFFFFLNFEFCFLLFFSSTFFSRTFLPYFFPILFFPVLFSRTFFPYFFSWFPAFFFTIIVVQ